ncbi:MAG: type II toxin-antitoxin system VapC family toxin [Bacteroidota bacterium]
MNGNKALLDSNVIIDASKGKLSLKNIINKYDSIYTSIICYIEVMGYNFNSQKEKSAIESILQIIPILNLDKEIADIAINFRKKIKIKLPDALIIATAEKMAIDLITSNIDDFKNLSENINVIKPNPDKLEKF